jgi:hypothetical protein
MLVAKERHPDQREHTGYYQNDAKAMLAATTT